MWKVKFLLETLTLLLYCQVDLHSYAIYETGGPSVIATTSYMYLHIHITSRELEIATKYNLNIPEEAPIIIHLGGDDESDDEDHFDEPTPTTSINQSPTQHSYSHISMTKSSCSANHSAATPNTSIHPSILLDIIGDWFPDTQSADGKNLKPQFR